MITRQQLEDFEKQTLASYALMSADSRGRFHHDHEPNYRTAFQRDHDRIIHSAAFRRLEYKTQVFVNDEGDYYRTRLTHTLEVAQIGRTLARALGANLDLTETICLAHDLGHAPFGHAGEYILDEMMAEYGGFNHNHQSYRVVTEIENRYPQWKGLNLTYETLEGIAKHESEYDVPSAYGFMPQLKASLEAQIANLADELAYNAHDLDDGLQANLITLDQLKHLPIWKILCERLKWQETSLNEIDRHRFIRELVGILVDDVLTETHRRLESLQPKTALDIQQHSDLVVGYSEQQRQLNRELKDFLYENMYHHFRVVRMQERARLFIRGLFESYVKEPRQLPNEFRHQIDVMGVYRVVADYIACMTDRSALLEYQHLFDPMTRP
jgi:dGTPase